MDRGQQEKRITIHVIDDNQWEPDETFFVKLSLPESEEARAKLGSKTVALVQLLMMMVKKFFRNKKKKKILNFIVLPIS